ncbi:MAG TPA: magnesium chelatase domain-containing protein [Chloroflexota bacterium]|nr:magnesium chelatase domain-containing protein [Chloroflexota bacterium]
MPVEVESRHVCRVNSCALVGLEGVTVDVEVDISRRLAAFNIVGLPDADVQESKERVRAASGDSAAAPNRLGWISGAPENGGPGSHPETGHGLRRANPPSYSPGCSTRRRGSRTPCMMWDRDPHPGLPATRAPRPPGEGARADP